MYLNSTTDDNTTIDINLCQISIRNVKKFISKVNHFPPKCFITCNVFMVGIFDKDYFDFSFIAFCQFFNMSSFDHFVFGTVYNQCWASAFHEIFVTEIELILLAKWLRIGIEWLQDSKIVESYREREICWPNECSQMFQWKLPTE
ncbi:hypothetical protein T01_3365 [Trichinella spiralis]|uniref:Uncharacterized protein n=1 Tax=Trichinella spiralis TaxID=6334 RepID=A0A0V1BSM1_TRISP|nr:hypothetical protein T01_3365 [Trichinella spiralis]